MTSRLSRHALAAGVAACALALVTAAPGVARPAGHPRSAGAYDARNDPSVRTGSLAGTTEANHSLSSATTQTASAGPDDGATTIAVLVIAGGTLLAGAGAGFAGGRRVALRTH
jgi:hypothetical protein